MFEPVLIIPQGIIFAGMGTPTLLPGHGRNQDSLCKAEQRFQLKGFQEICVETESLVVYGDLFVAIPYGLNYCVMAACISALNTPVFSPVLFALRRSIMCRVFSSGLFGRSPQGRFGNS